eukprot:jgi/Hompol1/205/HPOL_004395-RA
MLIAKTAIALLLASLQLAVAQLPPATTTTAADPAVATTTRRTAVATTATAAGVRPVPTTTAGTGLPTDHSGGGGDRPAFNPNMPGAGSGTPPNPNAPTVSNADQASGAKTFSAGMFAVLGVGVFVLFAGGAFVHRQVQLYRKGQDAVNRKIDMLPMTHPVSSSSVHSAKSLPYAPDPQFPAPIQVRSASSRSDLQAAAAAQSAAPLPQLLKQPLRREPSTSSQRGVDRALPPSPVSRSPSVRSNQQPTPPSPTRAGSTYSTHSAHSSHSNGPQRAPSNSSLHQQFARSDSLSRSDSGRFGPHDPMPSA